MNKIIKEDVESILAEPLPWHQFDGKHVLISGAGGFLPAYIVEVLAARNQKGARTKITGLVRSPQRAINRLGHLAELGLELIHHDICDPLPTGLPKAEFIIHAASQASPKFYGTDPVGTLKANTFGTAHLLEHAHKSNSESFLFFSSGEVYGIPTNESSRLTESDYGFLDPATIRACYGESKRLGETMCVSWAHQYGVPAKIVRPFHTYGPGMDLSDGRVFADFVSNVISKRDIILKSDGAAMRPFCYLSDAVAGFFSVMLLGKAATAYNIGNPYTEISVSNLAYLLMKLFPSRVKGVHFQPRQLEGSGYLASQLKRATPDISRAQQLGWQPKISLEAGFSRTVDSFLLD